ncbi:MAG: hypothetical protein ACRC33_17585, partial [Gemmataceae bacterium]
MLRTVRGFLVFGLLAVSFSALAVRAEDEKDGVVANPKYKFWATQKPGATAVHAERTVLSGEEKASYPDGVDEKVIAYKLLSVSADKVVVQAVVVEREFLGTVESAPTKVTYPAKIKKAALEAAMEEFGAKVAGEEETVKVGGK